jgi:hypothetical protein
MLLSAIARHNWAPLFAFSSTAVSAFTAAYDVDNIAKLMNATTQCSWEASKLTSIKIVELL